MHSSNASRWPLWILGITLLALLLGASWYLLQPQEASAIASAFL